MDIKLKLLAGLPIYVKDVGNIYPLKLKEVAELGEIKYNSCLSALCFDIDDLNWDENMVMPEGITTFDIMMANCTKDEEFKSIVLEGLSLFLKEKVEFINYVENDSRYLFLQVGNENKIIYRDNYKNVKYILMQQNHIIRPKKEEYNPANEQARKLIEQIKKNRANAPKIKPSIDLHSIMSGVAWKGQVGIEEILDLTVYQLYDAYYRLEVVDNYDKTMQGVYAGTIDVKKIDLKKINWNNIIKLK